MVSQVISRELEWDFNSLDMSQCPYGMWTLQAKSELAISLHWPLSYFFPESSCSSLLDHSYQFSSYILKRKCKLFLSSLLLPNSSTLKTNFKAVAYVYSACFLLKTYQILTPQKIIFPIISHLIITHHESFLISIFQNTMTISQILLDYISFSWLSWAMLYWFIFELHNYYFMVSYISLCSFDN